MSDRLLTIAVRLQARTNEMRHELTNEIDRRVWRFEQPDGQPAFSMFQLSPPGTIINHFSQTECAWGLDGHRLLFLDESGEPTSEFEIDGEKDGRLRLAGRCRKGRGERPDPALVSWRSYDPAVPTPDSFRCKVDIERPERPLLVTFNGRGACFEDPEVRYEGFHFGQGLDVDKIRFAERDTRSAWYVDKVAAVTRILSTAIDTGYKRVVLHGQSAGGYGAMLFAELLGRSYPGVRFDSITLNPQTTIRSVDIDRIGRSTPARFIPLHIAPDARDGSELEETRIAELAASRPTDNVHHHMIYDCNNPAESFHADQIRDKPGVRFWPVPLGLPHAHGCGTLYGLGYGQSVCRDLLQ